MVAARENELLTETGPDTPGGKLLRRYWQPIALASELPPGAAPQAITILGEQLVLFRDDADRIGLLGLNCPHRRADLSFGRVEDGGLRCLYHGWLFNIEGRCMQQPAEPSDSTYKDEVRHTAYPCREIGNLIFTYMGPGAPPAFPNYEVLHVPDQHRFVNKTHVECNYLQALEGNIDPAHLSYLHATATPPDVRAVPGSNRSADFFYGDDRRPTIEIEVVDFGVRIYSIRNADDGKKYVRITNFIMPNKASIVGTEGRINQGHQINWHVPINDHCHLRFDVTMNREKPIDPTRYLKRMQGEVTPDGRLIRNRANRYLQDRSTMNESFSGMGPYFLAHDSFASETQGLVHDRTLEHLGSTDKCIVAARRQILRGIEAIERGEDPAHSRLEGDDSDLSHIVVLSEVVAANDEHKTIWQKHASPRHQNP